MLCVIGHYELVIMQPRPKGILPFYYYTTAKMTLALVRKY